MSRRLSVPREQKRKREDQRHLGQRHEVERAKGPRRERGERFLNGDKNAVAIA